jgi:aspartyl-tRNA(Asn)/glutamyl-tRNA(Gln) amidotransferase subunit B
MNYTPTIGLEIHAELKTRTKMFCDCRNDSLEPRPNVNICPICVGHPGTLPVINKQAVEAVFKVGLALGAEIPKISRFARKNYFYPDLPKGYQISQYDTPLCQGGYLEIQTNEAGDSIKKSQIPNSKSQTNPKSQILNSKTIRIRRIHLEEDTGKLIHPEAKHQDTGARQVADYSLVDFNRAGVPLMELVTEPDITSAQEAVTFSRELQLLLRYLDVSGADMEKGQMRVEANVSIRPNKERMKTNGKPIILADESYQLKRLINPKFDHNSISFDKNLGENFGTKVEIKNLNSFRALEEAITYEIERQSEILESDGTVIQETRGWDDTAKRTYSQRWKEEAQDYRYFPEPDLPPLHVAGAEQRGLNADQRGPNIDIETLRKEIPELPWAKRLRLAKEYGFSDQDTEMLVTNPAYCEFFEKAVSELAAPGTAGVREKELARLTFNYLVSDLRGLLLPENISIADAKITPEHFSRLVYMTHKGDISSRGAKDALKRMFETGTDPEAVIKAMGLLQMSDKDKLEPIAREVIGANQKAAEDYKKGKSESLQFLIGQVMAKSKGAANPKVAEEILKRLLS